MIIRNDRELQKMQEIGRIVALTLQEMANSLCPGLTTGELDLLGAKVLADQGAKSAPIAVYNFPGHTCISVNEEVAHGIPGPRILRPGDQVNIDVSASKNGFFADTAATFLLAPVKNQRRRLVEAAQLALEKALAAARSGNRLNLLGLAVEKLAHKHGYKTIRNLCGHGVGRTLHEDPETIYNYYEKKDKRILEAGMTLAVETFVAEAEDHVLEDRDGWTLKTPHKTFTAQFEHTIMVRDGEPLILTLPE
ncbi:MAG: type I methionyl aminopeptidase [Clostridiales bacterium]|jgi:methionyl aminopeptidase|nr:type I methionyl aminopeptidase [Clostridiales bacterium]MDR2711957.1 type I methionyl aminopeptidase [Clostridiales bacterium]